MRTQVTTVSCDFCGHGGPYTRPEDFRSFPGDVDLCRWCSSEHGPGRLECGKHSIEMTADGWTCSCGWDLATFRARFPPRMSREPRVIAVVPDLVYASARIHSEEWT